MNSEFPESHPLAWRTRCQTGEETRGVSYTVQGTQRNDENNDEVVLNTSDISGTITKGFHLNLVVGCPLVANSFSK